MFNTSYINIKHYNSSIVLFFYIACGVLVVNVLSAVFEKVEVGF